MAELGVAPSGQTRDAGLVRTPAALPLVLITSLTVIAVLIHGYHPYAEDGGIYLPGIYKLLDPALYPAWTGFVTAQSRFSLFPLAVAELVRLSGFSVMVCILGIYIVGIWTTLLAAWHILGPCCHSREACYGGVLIFALCLTTPVAGTSLILIDPYVTARTISTPCTLLAIVGALDLIAEFKRVRRVRMESAALCAVSMLVAVLMHGLMAAYAGGAVILLLCVSITRAKWRMIALGSVAAIAVSVAALLNLRAPTPPDGYAAVALTRYYWFLSGWQWYEIAGLVAPLFLLLALSRYGGFTECGRWLAQMAISAGLIGVVVSLLFARESARSYFVAVLQPLRIFLVVYIVMILFTCAFLAEKFLRREPLRWAVVLLPLGALMFFVQRQTYSHSQHLEFPWTSPRNDWERGFLWIRNNTPTDTRFALDAKYILRDGEDAQNFRAIAQRSSLPDYQKDGGLAAIEPDLTPEWTTGQLIQGDLAGSSDARRRAKLAEAGVRWLVLPANSETYFPCPYQNSSMEVCRIPDR